MRLRRLTIDYERRTMAVQLADGTEFVAPSEMSLPPPTTPLRRAVCDLARRELTLTLAERAEVTVELGPPDSADSGLAERPIVYLDQRDWVTWRRLAIHPRRSTTHGSAPLPPISSLSPGPGESYCRCPRPTS
jgi:hypothetical protein